MIYENFPYFLLQISLPDADTAAAVENNFFGWAIISLVLGMGTLFYALMKVTSSRHTDLLQVVKDMMQTDNSVKEVLIQQSALLSAQGETLREISRNLHDLNRSIEITNSK